MLQQGVEELGGRDAAYGDGQNLRDPSSSPSTSSGPMMSTGPSSLSDQSNDRSRPYGYNLYRPPPITVADVAERERRMLEREKRRERVRNGTAPASCVNDDNLRIPCRMWRTTKAEKIRAYHRARRAILDESKPAKTSLFGLDHEKSMTLKRSSDFQEPDPKRQKTSQASLDSTSTTHPLAFDHGSSELDGHDAKHARSNAPVLLANWHKSAAEIAREVRRTSKTSAHIQKKKEASPMFQPLSSISNTINEPLTIKRSVYCQHADCEDARDEITRTVDSFIPPCTPRELYAKRLRKAEKERQWNLKILPAWEKEMQDGMGFQIREDDHRSMAIWEAAVASHTHEENIAIVRQARSARDALYEQEEICQDSEKGFFLRPYVRVEEQQENLAEAAVVPHTHQANIAVVRQVKSARDAQHEQEMSSEDTFCFRPYSRVEEQQENLAEAPVASHIHEEDNIAIVRQASPARDAQYEQEESSEDDADNFCFLPHIRAEKQQENLAEDVVMEDEQPPSRKTPKRNKSKVSKTQVPSSRITRSKANRSTKFLKLDRSGKRTEAWN